MDKQLKKDFLDFLTGMIQDLDYTEIDCFCEDNKLKEDEIKELQNLPVKVIEDK